ncbi:hypothetical protein GCM10010245_86780 [Streptomyces spectabilis]|uniref:Uncharacterized protein n=1 Tax=Streptomyces spectabilis TaxID=68270 RepID=A0A7W8EZ67_STRST|nr:hypothetical protein [Streptomyces spectabilis]MBB5109616.1 hypothetical protein [Streptomyces spectabilis]GGV54812.1 hypothetical protein GCM10010245_86780 [Streptomyces spectabilis]
MAGIDRFRRGMHPSAAAAVVATAVWVTIAFSAVPSMAAAREETINLVSRASLLLPSSQLPGVAWSGNANLYTPDGAPAGTATGGCIITKVSGASGVPAATSHCNIQFALALPDGRVGDVHTSAVMVTSLGPPSKIEYAINGGTKDFRNAAGDATSTLTSAVVPGNPTEWILTFRLTTIE